MCAWGPSDQGSEEISSLAVPEGIWINVQALIQCPGLQTLGAEPLISELKSEGLRESGNASFFLPEEVLKLGKEEGR